MDLTPQQQMMLSEGICPLCESKMNFINGELEFISQNLWQCQRCSRQYELVFDDSIVTPDNPIKIFPDGNLWCALVGENLQEGTAVFGDTPEQALTELLHELSEQVSED